MMPRRAQLIALCAALLAIVAATRPPAIAITITLPGWYPAACLCGGLVGLYLLAERHQAAIREWIGAIVAWLYGE
jgi:hypothetical protein